MSLKESLTKLMKENGWTAESVRKAIKSLQSVSVEKGNLIPYCLLGEKKQKILECLFTCGGTQYIDKMVAGRFVSNGNYPTEAEGIYRINPDFTIDLSETKPRYENETPKTVIRVWEITPNLDSSYDSAIIRGYQEAVEYAKSVVSSLMDDIADEFPIEIKIASVEITLAEYEEFQVTT